MPSNVFRLHGHRGEHRQYYYLVPVIDDDGNLVKEYLRLKTQGSNEWSEPYCRGVGCSGLCRQVSVFLSCVTPSERISESAPLDHCSRVEKRVQDWRAKFASDNKGCYFHIYDKGGLVRVTKEMLEGRGGGMLARVERVPVSDLGRHGNVLQQDEVYG